MSTEKTRHLQLNKWAPTDRLFLDEWNENFETIDRQVENTKTHLSKTGTKPELNDIGKEVNPSAIKYVETIPSSVNLLDLSKVENGGYYEYSTGVWTEFVEVASSGLIPVDIGQLYSKNTRSGQITFWDESNNFVSGLEIEVATTFTVPTNNTIAYMRVTISHTLVPLHEVMLVMGSVLPLEYVSYSGEKYKFPKDKFVFEVDENERKSEIFMTPDIKEYERVTNPVITKEIVTDRQNPSGTADPFIVFDAGKYHMFFEVLGGTNPNNSQTSDEIGHAWSYNLVDWNYTQIVLSHEIHGHRSAYPNVFKYDGDWYMLPDTMLDVKLYKAINFPTEWEFQENLLPGTFVDTNVFKIGEIWFMTTSTIPADNVILYYNTSGDWRNTNWTIHPLGNIIAQDGVEKGKRNAGNIFHGGDYIIMPVQITPVATNMYGEYTHWYKISDLTTTDCTITNLGKAIEASHIGDWKNDAMHHISHVDHSNGTIFAVDGLRDGEYTVGLYKDA
ncbi:hypothetical protein [Psychrobacillus sp. NPDC096623]|uniref:glucosamine inositolphosphorylceramide transferase family protein n=1 Tax=Psychrobacillus sp. NPDC096623 TaxID=3364492 RepID=UPI0037F92B30